MACLALAGCGGAGGKGATDGGFSPVRKPDRDTKIISWRSISTCLDSKGIDNNGHPYPGETDADYNDGNDSPPYGFSSVSGGWLVARLGETQRVFIMFYGNALDAERQARNLAGFEQKGGFFWTHNVLTWFDETPTGEEIVSIARCIPLEVTQGSAD
jgi:hypothetical protein